jgi:hypothetical protein
MASSRTAGILLSGAATDVRRGGSDDDKSDKPDDDKSDKPDDKPDASAPCCYS